jgi:hypothetical protein
MNVGDGVPDIFFPGPHPHLEAPFDMRDDLDLPTDSEARVSQKPGRNNVGVVQAVGAIVEMHHGILALPEHRQLERRTEVIIMRDRNFETVREDPHATIDDASALSNLEVQVKMTFWQSPGSPIGLAFS